MAAITAFTQKIFGLSNPSDTSLTKFGSTAGGSTAYSADPAAIQTPTWLNGWLPATILNTTKRLPIYTDMNSAFYVLSSGIALIQQEGIGTYLADKEYELNSIVRQAGTTIIYRSIQNTNVGNSLSDGAWWAQCGDLQYLPSSPLGIVGMMASFPSNAAPSGWLALSGQLVSRVTYANLWAFAQASGNISANDGAWTAGQFSPGDGTTTFRLPDYRGYFMRGWANGGSVDSGRTIGTTQNDAFQGHGHSGIPHDALGGVGFFAYGAGTSNPAISLTTTVTDGVNGTPRIATETRPINLSALMCIKY